MPRVRAEFIDESWAKVAAATARGDLGIAAKVSTLVNNDMNPRNEGRQLHVICVYTADCRDVDDVVRVLSVLREMGFTQRLSYKEDGATFANIYGNGAALYVSQPDAMTAERRREPVPTPTEYLDDPDVGR